LSDGLMNERIPPLFLVPSFPSRIDTSYKPQGYSGKNILWLPLC
jgi:hypothetical protein